jgi:large subunit ribosomal protein L21
MQAVVQMGSSQFLVSEGMELLVEHPNVDAVLMVIDGENIEVGTPTVAGITVGLIELGEEKGKKVRVAKYKAKSRYKKTRGFRAQFTRVKIESISKGEPKPKSEAKAEKTAAKRVAKPRETK